LYVSLLGAASVAACLLIKFCFITPVVTSVLSCQVGYIVVISNYGSPLGVGLKVCGLDLVLGLGLAKWL